MDEKIIYKDWIIAWLKSREGFVKDATYGNYSMAIINHIIPRLGDFAVDEISESIVQSTIMDLLDSGRIDRDGGLSRKTVKDILMIIKLSLRAAWKKHDLPFVDLNIVFPKSERIEKLKVLSPENQQQLIQASLLDLNVRNAGILLALYTGLRIGEICSLQWKDINIEERKLKVTKTIQRVYFKGVDGTNTTRVIISTPKTYASIREVPLSTFIIPVLKKIKSENPEVYVITGDETYLEPRTYRSYYDRFLKRIGVPHINFHGLRHTFATRLIEAGADVKTVSELLGHASVNLTLNLYVHPQMEQKRKCVELIQHFYL
ncbi:MAG: site-specific integrase [Clostridiales Family XIII bacterium]|jgi:integrase|nr:site-specific integrase [Clostridiales Family XIII bacterium]